MKKLAFYANNLSERGTAVATYDYAKFARDLLGYQSLIAFDQTCPDNNPKVVKKIQSEFETIPANGFAQADARIKAEGCDALYVLKYGARDEMVSKFVPTMVHCVFPNSIKEVHGNSYAYVSEWLSDVCSNKCVPWVPHIVSIGSTEENMRRELGVPEEAKVFGCYGGRQSFDIGFVKDVSIPSALEADPSIWFLFMNVAPFIEHPRVIFLAGTVDIEEKTAFINSCDAMLHARSRGETFGLAVGEFSLRGKPVLTCGFSEERAHIQALGAAAILYHSPEELVSCLVGFEPGVASAKWQYEANYLPKPVMEKFAKHLVQPILDDPSSLALDRMGHVLWNPFFHARLKLKKKQRRRLNHKMRLLG